MIKQIEELERRLGVKEYALRVKECALKKCEDSNQTLRDRLNFYLNKKTENSTSATSHIKNIESKLKEKDEQINELRLKLKRSDSELKNLSLKVFDKDRSERNDEVRRSHENRLNTSEQYASSLNKKIDDLNKVLEITQNENNASLKTIRDQLDRYSNLEKKLNEKSEELDQYKLKNQTLKSEIDQINSDLKIQNVQEMALNSNETSLPNEKNVDLGKKLMEQIKAKITLGKEVNHLKNLNIELENTNSEQLRKLSDMEQRSKANECTLKSELYRKDVQIREMQKDIYNYKQNNRRSINNFNNKNSYCQALDVSKQELAKKYADSDMKYLNAIDEINSLRKAHFVK